MPGTSFHRADGSGFGYASTWATEAPGPRIPEVHATHSKTPFEGAPVRIDNLS